MNRLRGFSVPTLLFILGTGMGWAPKDMGSIVGTVCNPSVVAGAKETVADVNRGTTSETTTSETGEYSVNPLPVGRYSVTVEKQGFPKTGPIEVNMPTRPEVNFRPACWANCGDDQRLRTISAEEL